MDLKLLVNKAKALGLSVNVWDNLVLIQDKNIWKIYNSDKFCGDYSSIEIRKHFVIGGNTVIQDNKKMPKIDIYIISNGNKVDGIGDIREFRMDISTRAKVVLVRTDNAKYIIGHNGKYIQVPNRSTDLSSGAYKKVKGYLIMCDKEQWVTWFVDENLEYLTDIE